MNVHLVLFILLLFVTFVNCTISTTASGVDVIFSGQGSNPIGVEIKWNGNNGDSEYVFSTSDPFTYSPITPLSYYTYVFDNSVGGSFVSLPLPPNNIAASFPKLSSSVQTNWTSAIFSGTFNLQPRTQGNLVSCASCVVGYRVCVTLLGVSNTGFRYELNTTCTNYTINTFSSSHSIPLAHAFHLDLYTYGSSNRGEFLSTRMRVIDGTSSLTGPNNNIVPVSVPNFPQFVILTRTTNSFSFSFSDKISTDAIRFTISTITTSASSIVRTINYWTGGTSTTVDSSVLPSIKSSQKYDLSSYHVLSFLNAVQERTSTAFLFTKPDLATNFLISAATNSSVSLYFEHPPNRGNGYLYYKVFYTNQYNQIESITLDNINSTIGAVVELNSNLRSNQRVTTYFTTVNLDYNNDTSITNSTFVAATLPKVDNFSVTSVSSNHVLLEWSYDSNKVFPAKDQLSDDISIVTCIRMISQSQISNCSSLLLNYEKQFQFDSSIVQPSYNFNSNVTFINRRLSNLQSFEQLYFTSSPSDFTSDDLNRISDNRTIERTDSSISITIPFSILNEGEFISQEISVECCIFESSYSQCVQSVQLNSLNCSCKFSNLPKPSTMYQITLQKVNTQTLQGTPVRSNVSSPISSSTTPKSISNLQLLSNGLNFMNISWSIPEDFEMSLVHYTYAYIGFSVCITNLDSNNETICRNEIGISNKTDWTDLYPVTEYMITVYTINSVFDKSAPISIIQSTLLPNVNIDSTKLILPIGNSVLVNFSVDANVDLDKLSYFIFSYMNRQNISVNITVSSFENSVILTDLKFSTWNDIQQTTVSRKGVISQANLFAVPTGINRLTTIDTHSTVSSISLSFNSAGDEPFSTNSIPLLFQIQINGTIFSSNSSQLQANNLLSGTLYEIDYSISNFIDQFNQSLFYGTANRISYFDVLRDENDSVFVSYEIEEPAVIDPTKITLIAMNRMWNQTLPFFVANSSRTGYLIPISEFTIDKDSIYDLVLQVDNAYSMDKTVNSINILGSNLIPIVSLSSIVTILSENNVTLMYDVQPLFMQQDEPVESITFSLDQTIQQVPLEKNQTQFYLLPYSTVSWIQVTSKTVRGGISRKQFFTVATGTDPNTVVSVHSSTSSSFKVDFLHPLPLINNADFIPIKYYISVLENEVISVNEPNNLIMNGLQSGTLYTVTCATFNNVSETKFSHNKTVEWGTTNKITEWNVTRNENLLSLNWTIEMASIIPTNLSILIQNETNQYILPVQNYTSFWNGQIANWKDFVLMPSVDYNITLQVWNPFGVDSSPSIFIASLIQPPKTYTSNSTKQNPTIDSNNQNTIIAISVIVPILGLILIGAILGVIVVITIIVIVRVSKKNGVKHKFKENKQQNIVEAAAMELENI